MSGSDLPSGMGKKIADALRKQSKSPVKESAVDIVDDPETMQDVSSSDEFSDLHNETEKYMDKSEFSLDDAEDESAYDDLDMYGAPSLGVEHNSEDYAPVFKMESGDISDNPDFTLDIDNDDDAEEFEMPNNINVLKRLITQLPTGVSKQTGAQIIRQTIEALGIPMKSVLQDAQRVKECLNSSIKDCGYTIQEYKSNIRNLEKQSLSYQKQLTKLNDIIGLFVYTDKK